MVPQSKKKEVLDDWGYAFPQLSKYSSSLLLMKLDVVLIGLSLDRLPRCEEYRPLFVCFPLWRSDQNENMRIPVFIHEMRNKKKRQLDIPYESHQELFSEVATYVKKEVGILLREQVFLKDIFNFLSNISSSILVQNNPLDLSRLLEYELAIALFFDDKNLLNRLKCDIEKKIKMWEPEHFKRVFNKTMYEWRNDLFDEFENRESFLERINNSLADKKVKALKTGHMLQWIQ